VPLIGEPVVAVPVVVHGVPTTEDGADKFGFKTCGIGLSPPTPSSVEPIGMPLRPTDDGEAIPVGEEADAAGDPDVLLPILAQVPDAVPALPPPSNTVDETDVPAVDIPVPTELPVIALMPDKFPAIELTLEQVVVLNAGGPSGNTPDVMGLTPGEFSSVAPRGIPVPGTAGAAPMPSGEVIPSGEAAGGVAPTCADAGPKPINAVDINATVVAVINRRVITGSPSLPESLMYSLALPAFAADCCELLTLARTPFSAVRPAPSIP
jgi:hypothetical protein